MRLVRRGWSTAAPPVAPSLTARRPRDFPRPPASWRPPRNRGHFIALSDRVGQRVHFRLTSIVMMVAVADNMPDDCESSAMAFLMAISNIFGGDLLAPLCGSWLLDGLKIKRGQYDNLVWAVTVRTIARLIPIPFIWWLIPAGSSLDKVRFDKDDLDKAGGPPGGATDIEIANTNVRAAATCRHLGVG